MSKTLRASFTGKLERCLCFKNKLSVALSAKLALLQGKAPLRSRMIKTPRVSFALKLSEETFKFLILIYETKGELNPLNFDRIKIKGV